MIKSKETKMKTKKTKAQKKKETESKLFEVEIDSEDGNPIVVYHVANNVEDFILPIRVSHPNEIISVWEISDEDSLKRSTTKALHIFGSFFEELQNSMPMPVAENILMNKMGALPIDLGLIPMDFVNDEYQLSIDFDE